MRLCRAQQRFKEGRAKFILFCAVPCGRANTRDGKPEASELTLQRDRPSIANASPGVRPGALRGTCPSGGGRVKTIPGVLYSDVLVVNPADKQQENLQQLCSTSVKGQMLSKENPKASSKLQGFNSESYCVLKGGWER